VHLLGLINDILDLAKVEAGKAEVEVHPVALDEMVRATLTELQGAVRDRPVELRHIPVVVVSVLAADSHVVLLDTPAPPVAALEPRGASG